MIESLNPIQSLTSAKEDNGSPVGAMQLHDPVLQLTGLIGREAEVADVVGAVLVLVEVSELSLRGVGAQQSVSDERAGEPTWQDVIAQL